MRIKKISSLFSILIVFFLTINSTVLSQNFNFKNYSLEDGLSQSEINCIYEDSRGYLWVGTSGGGLNRFDGNTFKVYEQKDGVCSQIISAITEDTKGNLWIGSQEGSVCVFNGKTFSKIEDGENKHIDYGKINFISIDDNKNVIVGKDYGLYTYNGKRFEKIAVTGDTIKNYKINCFKKDSRNITWIGTNKGVLVLKNGSVVHISDPNFTNNTNITSITEDIYGNLWAIKDNKEFYIIKIIGPSHYQIKAIKINTVQLPENTKISSIHFDRKNQLWVASDNKGIIKISANSYQQFDQRSGLYVENIKNIYEDASGNLWFGTSGGGLIKFTNQAFAYFDNLEGFNSPDIFAINADNNNNIWIGTQLHGIYKFDGKTTQNIHTALDGEEVRCIYTDKQGITWFGGSTGILKYNGNTFTAFKGNDDLKNIRAIFEDSKGNMWIGTRGHGVFIYEDQKSLSRIENRIENAYSFVEDKKGNVWVGSGSGIYVFENKKLIKHYTVDDGICNYYAGSMIKDRYNNIWVGTDNCVAKFDGTKFTSYGINEGLTSGTVYLLNTDTLGNIWVGTNKGLDKISLDSKGNIITIHNYGRAEGFKGIECNSRATCIDKDGCLWFGTIKGAIKFSPHEDVNSNIETPVIHINNIKLFYENVDWTKYTDSITSWFNIPYNAVIPYNKNQITFEFGAISKTFADNIKYSFKLDDFDNDWSPSDYNHTASYSNLAPGTYTFSVTALNKVGVWSKPETFVFKIKAPFYKTWWFTILTVIALIFLVYFYNLYRKRKHLLYKERLEKIIRERTSEIIKQRDEKEILLKEIHHRVKNNLQIINSLINIQSDYVADPKAIELFKEIRNRIRTISLVHEKLYKSEDYVNINVKEYINMLVENLIETYSIDKNIELKVDLHVEHFNLNTIIPLGLLLNEVISNSFKYAFIERNEGVIEISLNKAEDDYYILIIGDNGKGFIKDPFKEESSTLGIELIRILADQLDGTINKLDKNGTYYQLKFKPLKN